jgi:GNAT superfamily N-acetyltransferase
VAGIPRPDAVRPRPHPRDVTVRTMRPEEADRVGSITLASYDAYGSMRGEYRRYLADPMRRREGSSDLLVAEVAGQVVGTVTYVLPGDDQWEGRAVFDGDCAFRVLAVAPEAEGLGVGRRLVVTCLERSRALGCARMVITSMAWMDRAHALYRSLGFGRRPDLDVRFPGGDGFVFTHDLRPDAADRFPPPGPVPDELPWFEDVWER